MLTQNSINLSEVDFDNFLKTGIFLQKPGSETIYLGHGRDVSFGDSFHIIPFYGADPKKYIPEFLIKTNVSELQRFLDSKLKNKFIYTHKLNYDEHFLQDLDLFLDALKNNDDIQKLVAVTRDIYHIEDKTHPLSLLKNLNYFDSASVYAYWDKSSGIIGFSPEPLIEKKNSFWQTRALAGTIKSNIKGYADILKSDPKEQVEHEWVIEDIKNKIESLGELKTVSSTDVVEFGPIAHLQTIIHFDMNDSVSFQDAITRFSPTAALGGYPSQNVKTYLEKSHYFTFEKEKRLFGGVLGFESQEESFALVCIRNIQWKEDELIVDSGCGVVAESIPANELKEVQNKRQSILGALFD